MRRHSTWWPLLTLVLLSLIFLLRSVLVGLSAPQHRINQSHVLLAPSIHRREANPSLPAWTAGEDTFAMERTSRNPLVSVRQVEEMFALPVIPSLGFSALLRFYVPLILVLVLTSAKARDSGFYKQKRFRRSEEIPTKK